VQVDGDKQERGGGKEGGRGEGSEGEGGGEQRRAGGGAISLTSLNWIALMCPSSWSVSFAASFSVGKSTGVVKGWSTLKFRDHEKIEMERKRKAAPPPKETRQWRIVPWSCSKCGGGILTDEELDERHLLAPELRHGFPGLDGSSPQLQGARVRS